MAYDKDDWIRIIDKNEWFIGDIRKLSDVKKLYAWHTAFPSGSEILYEKWDLPIWEFWAEIGCHTVGSGEAAFEFLIDCEMSRAQSVLSLMRAAAEAN